MGIYINPTDGRSKEEWLAEYGCSIKRAEALEFEKLQSDKKMAVVLIDNLMFTVAGVCFDRDEAEAACRPDHRHKSFWSVPIEALLTKQSGCEVDLAKQLSK